jgi:hypothetical protein
MNEDYLISKKVQIIIELAKMEWVPLQDFSDEALPYSLRIGKYNSFYFISLN